MYLMKKILFILFLVISFSTVVLAVDRNLTGIDLITREEWGANESWLLSGNSGYDYIINVEKKYEKDMERLKKNKLSKYKAIKEKERREKVRIDYLYKEFSDELSFDKIVTKLEWVALRWKMFFHYNKTRIIIHHTAGTYSNYPTKEKFIIYLQGVYKFHTFTRWWGDIWYNFIIDPWGNIYEWKAGWEWVVGAHLKYNNISSIGIALAGNFDIDKPTQEQIQALEKLWAVLATKYNINPYTLVDFHRKWWDKYPYIEEIKNLSIIWHRDAGYTSCPWANLYTLLPDIRRAIYQKSKLLKSKTHKIITKKEITKKKASLSLLDRIKLELNKRFNLYISTHENLKTNNLVKKINYHIKQQEISKLERKPIKVLLYELSTKFSKWETSFIGDMELINGNNIIQKSFSKETDINITYNKGKFYYAWKSYEKIIITSSNIVIKNYNRKSYVGLPLNIFEWKLIFMKDKIKVGTKYINTSALINELSFFSYLKGIGEAWDDQPYQKIKAMTLLVKGYIIFYLEKKNLHPSIPTESYYNAIDDPRFFQKFVGKWFIKVWKKWQKAIKDTKGRYIIYKWELAFTPYFSCSVWFTFDAKDRWGWTDTPYLESKLDFVKCKDFLGHGVGLSGRWAEFLANKWLKYWSIIRWYFPGVEIVNIREL